MGDERPLRVLGLAGSPRHGGNTDTLLDRALDGAREAGAEVERLALRELDVAPCRACAHCSKTGDCRFRDDMDRVYEALDRADRLILASPIQFAAVSAQAKIVIDRCQRYWARKYVLRLPAARPGRRGLFLSVGGFAKGRKFFDCASLCVRVWMITLDVKLAATLFRPGVDALGDIARHEDALQEAFRLGRDLPGAGGGSKR